MPLTGLLLWTYVLAFAGYWCLVAQGSLARRREVDAPRVVRSLGIVVPAYNEKRHMPQIARAVALAAELRVPLVIVDDGSSDGSSDLLDRACDHTDARVIHHATNRGKAEALNTGIEGIGTDLVLTLDADTIVRAEDVVAASGLFAPEVAAVALRVDAQANAMLETAQATEYAYVLNFERASLAAFGLIFTVPGAASLWRRTALARIGGFRSRTCAEDTDATISLSLAGWRLLVAATSAAHTDCPSSFVSLYRQRVRWIWGNIQVAGLTGLRLARRFPGRQGLNALAFVSMTAFVLFGYALVAVVAARVVVDGLDWSDLLAGLIFLLAAVMRIALVNRTSASPGGKSVAWILIHMGLMQVVNVVAFWGGLLSGRAWRHAWR